jgi:hypothetical protein
MASGTFNERASSLIHQNADLKLDDVGAVFCVQAAPYYSIVDNGDGTYSYGFDLVLDNNDGSWQAGQGFDWIIFGDAQNMPSPFADFVMSDGVFPVGPCSSRGVADITMDQPSGRFTTPLT